MDNNIFDLTLLVMSVIGIVAVPIIRFSINTTKLLPPGKKVGGSYWGVYTGVPVSQPEWTKTIKVHQPSLSDIVVAGSGVYASGKPVKSLRR